MPFQQPKNELGIDGIPKAMMDCVEELLFETGNILQLYPKKISFMRVLKSEEEDLSRQMENCNDLVKINSRQRFLKRRRSGTVLDGTEIEESSYQRIEVRKKLKTVINATAAN